VQSLRRLNISTISIVSAVNLPCVHEERKARPGYINYVKVEQANIDLTDESDRREGGSAQASRPQELGQPSPQQEPELVQDFNSSRLLPALAQGCRDHVVGRPETAIMEIAAEPLLGGVLSQEAESSDQAEHGLDHQRHQDSSRKSKRVCSGPRSREPTRRSHQEIISNKTHSK